MKGRELYCPALFSPLLWTVSLILLLKFRNNFYSIFEIILTKGQRNVCLFAIPICNPVKRFREMSTIKMYRKTDSQWLIHTQSWFCRCTSRCIWLGIKITTERSHIGQSHSKQGDHGLRNHDLSNAHPHGKRTSISPRGVCIHVADY